MAKKDKPFDYKNSNVGELSGRMDKTQQDLFKARFRAGSAAPKNTMLIRNLRREIARLHTFINAKNAQEVKGKV